MNFFSRIVKWINREKSKYAVNDRKHIAAVGGITHVKGFRESKVITSSRVNLAGYVREQTVRKKGLEFFSYFWPWDYFYLILNFSRFFRIQYCVSLPQSAHCCGEENSTAWKIRFFFLLTINFIRKKRIHLECFHIKLLVPITRAVDSQWHSNWLMKWSGGRDLSFTADSNSDEWFRLNITTNGNVHYIRFLDMKVMKKKSQTVQPLISCRFQLPLMSFHYLFWCYMMIGSVYYPPFFSSILLYIIIVCYTYIFPECFCGCSNRIIFWIIYFFKGFIIYV